MKTILSLALMVAVLSLGSGLARGQQESPVLRIGLLMNGSMSSPEGVKYREAFTRGLQELGSADGKNILIEKGQASRITGGAAGAI
jgi:hypothetical protein